MLVALAALGTDTSLAASYRVELVVFAREDNDALPEEPAKLGCLDRAQTIGAENGTSELPRALPAARYLLVNEARAIRRRGSGFRLLLHGAWEQEIAEGKAGPWLRLPAGAQFSGCLRANLKQAPEVEIDLSYLPDASEQYRFRTKRQLRPADVHYLDHPAVGVLLRVDPVGAEAAAASPTPSGPAPSTSVSAGTNAPPGVIPPPPKKPFRW